MGPYRTLFTITVEHTFFSDGLCPGLRFVPSPQSSVVMTKARLLARTKAHGICIFYDAESPAALQMYAADRDEPLCLAFKVYATDPLFQNYTHPAVHREQSMLCFDNQAADSEASGRLCLHRDAYVTDSDFKSLDSVLLGQVLSKEDRLVRPHFIAGIFVTDHGERLLDKGSPWEAKNYFIRFQARETFWKYYLLGAMRRHEAYIADLNTQTEFDCLGETALSDNRTAVTFRSKIPIPLRDESDRRFQLRERNAKGAKVLIKRLPVASASQINRETIGGKEAAVSEIYINC